MSGRQPHWAWAGIVVPIVIAALFTPTTVSHALVAVAALVALWIVWWREKWDRTPRILGSIAVVSLGVLLGLVVVPRIKRAATDELVAAVVSAVQKALPPTAAPTPRAAPRAPQTAASPPPPPIAKPSPPPVREQTAKTQPPPRPHAITSPSAPAPPSAPSPPPVVPVVPPLPQPPFIWADGTSDQEARDSLRAKTGVVLLHPRDDALGLDAVPAGFYGFVSGLGGAVPAWGPMHSLRRERKPGAFEFHCLGDNVRLIVGFVDDATAQLMSLAE